MKTSTLFTIFTAMCGTLAAPTERGAGSGVGNLISTGGKVFRIKIEPIGDAGDQVFQFSSTQFVKATPDQVVNGTTKTGGLPGASGTYNFGINSQTDTICYNITLYGFRGEYQSPAATATHIHEAARGASGPPRIAFPNPQPVAGNKDFLALSEDNWHESSTQSDDGLCTVERSRAKIDKGTPRDASGRAQLLRTERKSRRLHQVTPATLVKPGEMPATQQLRRISSNIGTRLVRSRGMPLSQPRAKPRTRSHKAERIYLGNLLYRIKPDEVEEMLATNGFGEEVETVHISIDAMTGRNPGYCFIDLKTRTGAQMALESLAGTSISRSTGQSRPLPAEASRSTVEKCRLQADIPKMGGTEQGPYGALDHLNEVRKVGAPARVFVGGLGKMINQVENDKEIRGYFDGFNVFVFLSITAFDFLLEIHITKRRKLTNEAANYEESQSANESSPIHPREQSPEIIITVSSISKAQRQPKLP
ncbi:hypothetical protein J7T55_000207 [Diaporthe amygdali]|uniref:uncharacterized protein n=1 Tax=Phomopsis amygdali TaxID=1214568 RepID=UPI0022FEA299|nr:uncharacterized protein J7T55_000207 [Diaporthe amygdali]KAJ0108241.1 hypothetical protein J7T55_000207 [Diaporthe amygdali]